MLTVSLYESGSEFKRIALLIVLLMRNRLMARASALESIEVQACACNQELP